MIGLRSDQPPVLLKYRSSVWYLTLAITMAVFTDIFLYAAIVPVVPFALTERVGINPSETQHWITVLLAVYGGALLFGSPICGWAADRWQSRRGPLLAGLLVLAGATVMLCLGRSIAVLVAGRVLQGLSASVVWTVGLALMADSVEPEEVGERMGYVTIGMSLGGLMAPLLGGVVFEQSGYYSVFAMCFALIGLDIFFRLTMIERKTAAKWLPSALPDLGLPSQVSAASAPPPQDPVGTDNTSSATRRRTNLPPLITLLRSPRLLAALLGCFVQASLLTSFDTILPLHVHAIFSWTSLGAGLIFLPLIAPSFVAPFIGAAADKYGSRYITALGFLLSAPFLALLRLVTHNSTPQKALLCVLLFAVGFAIDLAILPLMAEITYVVQAEEARRPGMFGRGGAYAQAYGLFNMAFAAGSLVGPIWSGSLVERAGWGTATWTLALLSGVSGVPILLFIGGWIGDAENRKRRTVKTESAGGGAGEEEEAVAAVEEVKVEK